MIVEPLAMRERLAMTRAKPNHVTVELLGSRPKLPSVPAPVVWEVTVERYEGDRLLVTTARFTGDDARHEAERYARTFGWEQACASST